MQGKLRNALKMKPALFVMLVLLTLLLSWYFYHLQPVSQTPVPETLFVVPKGQPAKIILARLKEAKFIRSALALDYYLYFTSQRSSFQAGSFRLSPSMTISQIIDQLQHGTIDIWVTIPEGLRSEEIAEIFRQALGESFDITTFIKKGKTVEGFLFPDTYLVQPTATADDFINLLTQTGAKKASTLPKVPPDEALPSPMTVASLIEREAKTAVDRKIVSGVLRKRLENGWPLQVDATLQYAKGYDAQKKTWWSPPLVEDKKINSPFNTYKYAGLPPHPICNPGLDSIEAALFPTKTDYFYYISEEDGTMHYAKTLEEHNANVNKYLR